MPVGRGVVLLVVVGVFSFLFEDVAGDVSSRVSLAGAVVVAGWPAVGWDVAGVAVDGIAFVASVFGFGGVVVVLSIVVFAQDDDVFFGCFAAGGIGFYVVGLAVDADAVAAWVAAEDLVAGDAGAERAVGEAFVFEGDGAGEFVVSVVHDGEGVGLKSAVGDVVGIEDLAIGGGELAVADVGGVRDCEHEGWG
mgnify:CR=1 FL=1